MLVVAGKGNVMANGPAGERHCQILPTPGALCFFLLYFISVDGGKKYHFSYGVSIDLLQLRLEC